MGIIGPLLWAPRKAQYILLMTDYFSKWVEAQVFEKVREKEVINIIWDHIICMFSIPTKITCDNRRQFIRSKINKFFEDHKIKKILSTPYRPSANNQAESKNQNYLAEPEEKDDRLKMKVERNSARGPMGISNNFEVEHW
ncbi:PREDICTED: uncharacterized protein LOC109206426 [Nicotiana attenuata]|uniref:uncharacterized protein LOC109206426 n=1 Tax=Nicotiana attenuata TaxID=49451 RepID=UPI0009050F4C|nr:PREDICTED: uncharacterized protein LOC109206426 [Nicotiana attenuata]